MNQQLHSVHQRGAALVIALLLLAIMTLLGASILRSTFLDERMSAGLYDRGLAFQAAEGALREAEGLMAAGGATFPASGCSAGMCAQIDRSANPDAPERWVDPSFTQWRAAVFTPAAKAGGNPDFIVETMGPAPNWAGCEQEVPMHPNCLTPRFRITARGGQDGRARVVLQTNYASSAP